MRLVAPQARQLIEIIRPLVKAVSPRMGKSESPVSVTPASKAQEIASALMDCGWLHERTATVEPRPRPSRQELTDTGRRELQLLPSRTLTDGDSLADLAEVDLMLHAHGNTTGSKQAQQRAGRRHACDSPCSVNSFAVSRQVLKLPPQLVILAGS